MQIKKVINVLDKMSKILKIYENRDLTLDEALDDIYKNVKGKTINHRESINIQALNDRLKNMNRSDIVQKLHSCRKQDLLEISNKIGMKVPKNEKNDIIIETIANAYSYKNLDKDMSNRNMTSDNFFEGQDNDTVVIQSVKKNEE